MTVPVFAYQPTTEDPSRTGATCSQCAVVRQLQLDDPSEIERPRHAPATGHPINPLVTERETNVRAPR